MKVGNLEINPAPYAGKSLQAAKKMSSKKLDGILERHWNRLQAELKEAGLKTEPKKKKEAPSESPNSDE